ncbi:MAG: glycoside hydrolase family 97 N-terminal domain-containing protein, partial [Prevotella sp.]|nr:glycoside hydrolase family 97 N-terminal domain-containing protein [Prevotella sp.]
MKRLFFLINFSFLISHFSFGASVLSPNGNVVLNFAVEQGRPVYSVQYKGNDVIRPSHLGLELAKDKHASMGLRENDLMEGFTIAKEETTTFDETWRPVWGETATIRNH